MKPQNITQARIAPCYDTNYKPISRKPRGVMVKYTRYQVDCCTRNSAEFIDSALVATVRLNGSKREIVMGEDHWQDLQADPKGFEPTWYLVSQ